MQHNVRINIVLEKRIKTGNSISFFAYPVQINNHKPNLCHILIFKAFFSDALSGVLYANILVFLTFLVRPALF
jgi:hypothetical protein